MHIIARPAINQAIRRHADAANWLNAWWIDRWREWRSFGMALRRLRLCL